MTFPMNSLEEKSQYLKLEAFSIQQPIFPLYIHRGERIDGDRHSQNVAGFGYGAMINQDVHGSGDHHRSFPGGIYPP